MRGLFVSINQTKRLDQDSKSSVLPAKAGGRACPSTWKSGDRAVRCREVWRQVPDSVRAEGR
eukprot:3295251-Alexandrium_andersonii.AAC.1